MDLSVQVGLINLKLLNFAVIALIFKFQYETCIIRIFCFKLKQMTLEFRILGLLCE